MSSRIGWQERGLKDVEEIEEEGFERVLVVGVGAGVDGLDVVEEDDEAFVEALSRHLRDTFPGRLHAEHVVVVIVVVVLKNRRTN